MTTRRAAKASDRTRFASSMPDDALRELPAIGGPAGLARVQPVEQPPPLVDVEYQEALHRFLHRVQQRHAKEARVRRPVPDLVLALEVAREHPADLDTVDLLRPCAQLRERDLLEENGEHADDERGEEDGQAHPVEAHPRRLE